MVVGMTVSLAVMQPDTMPELILGTGMAAVGGMISDIDVGTSESHREADRVIRLTYLVTALAIILDYFFDTDLIHRVSQNHSFVRIIIGFAVFLAICIYGRSKPHRTFMHSFLALILLSASAAVILPTGVPYFAIAFLTHLFMDLLNWKKVQLFYPSPRGFSLKLFHSRGIFNYIFFAVGSVLAVVEICLGVLRCL